MLFRSDLEAFRLSGKPGPDGLGCGFLDRPVGDSHAALTLTGPEGFGRYPYVTVLRADANNPSNPQLVFDNRPEDAQAILQFVLGTPPTEQVIPADVFASDGIYVVILFALNRGTDLLPNTFLGSPILAGSGAPRFLLVGEL